GTSLACRLHATRVRVPSRACRRVWAIKPNSRHISQEPLRSLPRSAQSESLQKLIAICGHIGFRTSLYDVCNGLAYACVYRGCQKGMGFARMRPAEHRPHSHDLSALVDLVSHGWQEVGSCGKQRIKAGHHAVLPDECMRPVEARVQGASHHLAVVVDAGGD